MHKKLPFIERARTGNMDFKARGEDNPRLFLFLFMLGSVFFMLVLALRLFQLTIVKGQYYRRLSDENRIRSLVIEPKRGSIFDRKGMALAYNDEANLKELGARLSSRRVYTEPIAASHIIGYRQLADKRDLDNDLCLSKLKLGSKVGKQGVEKIFECQLRGRYGQKLIEVDARGKYVKTLSVVSPEPGQSINLALDLDLQQKAYAAIAGRHAAVVALKPSTGEILVLASSPSFNLQDFEDTNQAQVASYIKDSNKPLFDRALEGVYPPGSVFKPVVAAGALEEKAIDEHTTFEEIL